MKTLEQCSCFCSSRSLCCCLFLLPRVFGCCARAHKAWRSEAVPLKRQILDAPPKSHPSFFVFTLCIPPFFSFVFFFFLSCLSLLSSASRRSCCCRRSAADEPPRCPSLPPFLYHPSIHPASQPSPCMSSRRGLRHELRLQTAFTASPPPCFYMP